MKKTLIYIDNFERYAFYKRLMQALENKKEFVIVTNKFSIFLQTKGRYKTYLLKKDTSSHVEFAKNLEKTLSTACGYHTLKQAERISMSVNAKLKKIFQENEIEQVFVFNGTTTIGKTIGDFCKVNNTAASFIEISNLPNKLFVDKSGTNAKSYLYKHPEILDQHEVSDTEFEEWKEKYIENKTAPKQAKNKTKIRYVMILDYIGFWCLNALREDFRNPLKVIKNKLSNRVSKEFLHADLSEEYIFFPLQVSNDSQIILNSDVDNTQAIEKIKQEFPDTKILIKPHPAEENTEFIQKIESFEDNRTKIVSNDTNELIKNAKVVCTINSTVGLEAMIFGKEVKVFGRALYAGFTCERLKSYICGYLVNIDYFDGEIKQSEAMRLYEK